MICHLKCCSIIISLNSLLHAVILSIMHVLSITFPVQLTMYSSSWLIIRLRWFQDLSIFEIRNDLKIESIIDQITLFYFLELFDIVIANFQ